MTLVLAAFGGALIFAVVLISTQRDKSASWEAAVEGFLAIATPCCTRASLWDSLDTVTSDGQRARPASVAEAAQWLNEWPYRSREDHDGAREEIPVALQSSEVRCTGPATEGEISRYGTDEETLERIRQRRECVYAKWKVWSEETADGTPNERHTVWVDEDGFFHGRVDYWQ
ncbi:MAG: hypothetical protein OEM15_17890 [Myxococcales bacterium]|nr:hypothetical protein [Myxococcales bacterium]MDH3484987.1 hypothetical protein [Myxococcales bacterium]